MAAPAGAAIMRIDNMPLGKVVNINGQKFVKVGNDSTNGSRFIALKRACPAGIFNGYDMQEFTTADCECLNTPIATNYTLAGTMVDSRDGKSYEVRKFADGKCWMVDNLMYGGGTDGSSDYCTGKTAFRTADSANNSTATAINGLNPTNGSRNTLVGDCRDPRAGGLSPCTAGSTTCGYYYNWSAALQDVNGWYGNSFQPTRPTQGICPPGWHIPSGDTTGEYRALHTAAGSPFTGFWQPGGFFKGIFSGECDFSGLNSDQGMSGQYWSSTRAGLYNVSNLNFYANSAYPTTTNSNPQFYGFTVRCIKN